MDCPLCREPMVVLELNEVEIDHCLSCGGIWLDSGELELLLEASEERDNFLSSFKKEKKSREKTRKCPICFKKMEKVICGIDQKILIDHCGRDHGLWFDAGELETVIKMGSFDKNNKVLHLLKDMFGRKE